jgi:hypothetical protein
MANIQQILGTDSISASRTVINDNFSAINAELGDILNYLDTTNLTLSSMSLVESDQITVPGAADLSLSGNTFSVASEFTSSLEMAAAVYKSAYASVSTFPATLTNVHGTIILDASMTATSNLANGASDGHEITVLARAAYPDALNASNILGFTTENVDFTGNGSTITLRWSQTLSKWIVISSYATTIS